MNLGSLTPDDNILLTFYDTTNFDGQYNVVGHYLLNRDSAFFEWTNSQNEEFEYVLTARFLNWFQVVNGKSYRAQLGYFENGQAQYIHYDWTMSLTAEQQQTEEQITQQEINQGINDLNNNINELNNSQQEMNDFLKDDTFNTDIIDMPTIDIITPSSTYVDQLFSILRNAFIGVNGQDFVFTFPFSNVSFTIPANYLETHVPVVIIKLIRLVYWFLISRFIFKDIMTTLDSIRQGDYFSASEKNIKTEVL